MLVPDSRLEADLGLRGLIDEETFFRLSRAFAALSGFAVELYELDGSPLVEGVRTSDPGELSASADGPRCSELQRGADRLLRVRLEREGNGSRRTHGRRDPIGHLVVGPLPLDLDTSESSPLQAQLSILCKTIERIVRTNYRSYLHSKMSLRHFDTSLLIAKDAEQHASLAV